MTIILSNKTMEVKQNYYVLTPTVLHMKLKIKMFTKTPGMIKINLIILKTLYLIKLTGKFKYEATGIPITEFIRLKDNDKAGKAAKGIKNNVIKKNIKHENYKDELFNNKQMLHTMKMIGSYEINKFSLSCLIRDTYQKMV